MNFAPLVSFIWLMVLISPIIGPMVVPQDWYHVCEMYKPNDGQWALKTKAILERLQIVLADRSDYYQKIIQPSAQYLGNLLGVGKWAVCSSILSTTLDEKKPKWFALIFLHAYDQFSQFIFQIDIFMEDLIRAGASAILSILLNRFDPIIRRIANLGW